MDKQTAAALLNTEITAILPGAHGGNNRTFRVETAQGSYFAKQYFKSETDTRDRLESEWAFLTYCAQHSIPHVPRPVAKNKSASLAIYSFLQGERPQEVTRGMMAQAGAWIALLNAPRAQAKNLPTASEACFSAPAYVDHLQQRLSVLERAEGKAEFMALRNAMQEAAARHSATLLHSASPAQELPRSAQCLSPSDFGFHNSLMLPDGTLQLIDFEYAGWDDPAKMLCDLLLHPGMEVNPLFFEDFWHKAKAIDSDATPTLPRARLLYPLLGLRWCCIILNVFVPQWAARRQFADANWNQAAAQEAQLEKAAAMLKKLETNPFA